MRSTRLRCMRRHRLCLVCSSTITADTGPFLAVLRCPAGSASRSTRPTGPLSARSSPGGREDPQCSISSVVFAHFCRFVLTNKMIAGLSARRRPSRCCSLAWCWWRSTATVSATSTPRPVMSSFSAAEPTRAGECNAPYRRPAARAPRSISGSSGQQLRAKPLCKRGSASVASVRCLRTSVCEQP